MSSFEEISDSLKHTQSRFSDHDCTALPGGAGSPQHSRPYHGAATVYAWGWLPLRGVDQLRNIHRLFTHQPRAVAPSAGTADSSGGGSRGPNLAIPRGKHPRTARSSLFQSRVNCVLTDSLLVAPLAY